MSACADQPPTTDQRPIANGNRHGRNRSVLKSVSNIEISQTCYRRERCSEVSSANNDAETRSRKTYEQKYDSAEELKTGLCSVEEQIKITFTAFQQKQLIQIVKCCGKNVWSLKTALTLPRMNWTVSEQNLHNSEIEHQCRIHPKALRYNPSSSAIEEKTIASLCVRSPNSTRHPPDPGPGPTNVLAPRSHVICSYGITSQGERTFIRFSNITDTGWLREDYLIANACQPSATTI
ncbi:hypothetical protein J6590_070910 [Homalodisca vitripennis]|nr:hypothetical protein J6590_070910 [Homalodisca vitripennis]